MANEKKFDSESFLLEIANRPVPGNLSLGKLVREIIDNERHLREFVMPELGPEFTRVYPLAPDLESCKTTLQKRQNLLYITLDRKEQSYFYGKDKNTQ